MGERTQFLQREVGFEPQRADVPEGRIALRDDPDLLDAVGGMVLAGRRQER